MIKILNIKYKQNSNAMNLAHRYTRILSVCHTDRGTRERIYTDKILGMTRARTLAKLELLKGWKICYVVTARRSQTGSNLANQFFRNLIPSRYYRELTH